MRILLDECVTHHLKSHLAPREIQTVTEAGWTGIKNSELLRRAEDRFDVFLPVDRNLPFQQDLSRTRIAIVLVHVPETDIEAFLPLIG